MTTATGLRVNEIRRALADMNIGGQKREELLNELRFGHTSEDVLGHAKAYVARRQANLAIAADLAKNILAKKTRGMQ